MRSFYAWTVPAKAAAAGLIVIVNEFWRRVSVVVIDIKWNVCSKESFCHILSKPQAVFGHVACKVCECNVFEKGCFASKYACAHVRVRKKSRAVIARAWLNTDLKGENKSIGKSTYFYSLYKKKAFNLSWNRNSIWADFHAQF